MIISFIIIDIIEVILYFFLELDFWLGLYYYRILLGEEYVGWFLFSGCIGLSRVL